MATASSNRGWLLAVGVMLALGAGVAAAFVEAPPATDRDGLRKQIEKGNFKDAYDGFRKIVLDPKSSPLTVGDDLQSAVQCLQRLGRTEEIDPFVEAAVEAHPKNHRALRGAARAYRDVQHHGMVVAGKFRRSNQHTEGQWVFALERDRVRALQLMLAADAAFDAKSPASERGDLQIELAGLWLLGREYDQSWRLQQLTDLKALPDPEEHHVYWGGRHSGQGSAAPVDEKGEPLYYSVPKTFEAARNDGERWRGALMQAVEYAPAKKNYALYTFAAFLRSQFDVQTLLQRPGFAPTPAVGAQEGETPKDGPYSVHTLGDDETICYLAVGVKRFKLPDEFNFIKLLKDVAADPKTGYGGDSLWMLADVYVDRRQLPKAAEVLDGLVKQYGDGPGGAYKELRSQIRDNWGAFQPISSQLAGGKGPIPYRFRNGKEVVFKAWKIDMALVLADMKAYLQRRPKQIEWSQISIDQIGNRIIRENQSKYLKEKVAEWKLPLKPAPAHYDRQIDVVPPLASAGAFLVTAEMTGGNVSRIVYFAEDAVLLRKPLDKSWLYVFADAKDGAPLAGANVEFIGWRQDYSGNTPVTHYHNFAENTDADGAAVIDGKRMTNQAQWIAIARGKEGKTAFLGFAHAYWNLDYNEEKLHQEKAYVITDRPVYRPAQQVKIKSWLAVADYAEKGRSKWAGKTVEVRLHDPLGNEVWKRQLATDDWGGLETTWDAPADAKLGDYQLGVGHLGGGHFRIEEYKKPEFEVTVDAPSEPVKLGDKIQAKIVAKYLFGSPVVKAKVKYKATRTEHDSTWYPIGPWDWLYGRGYLWCGVDYDWYPGWAKWGCLRPLPPWWGGNYAGPPEVVAEREVEIGPDGTVEVEIDTGLAKALFGDKDQSYTISAEVVDESRRTIVGSGSVLVSAKPFQVTTWIDRGYGRTGEPIVVFAHAETVGGKPVEGKGKLRLIRVTYDDAGKPTEEEVQAWDLATDPEGNARQQFKTAEPGQYRLSYELTDARKNTREGGCVFTVTGEGFNGDGYKFNELELAADQVQYKPGQKAELLVQTNRKNARVMLFLRPAGGVYRAPQFIQLKGKSATRSTPIATGDMPNFYVEAVAIADGKVYTEVKEILVPPEDRVVKVKATANAAQYLPGAKGSAEIQITDATGEPVEGSVVVALYDKAVDYIAGGSNVEGIREFFWNWRRHHSPMIDDSLARRWNIIPRDKDRHMQILGAFGGILEELSETRLASSRGDMGLTGAMGGMGGGGGGFGGGMAMPASAPMAAMDAMPMAKSARFAAKNELAKAMEGADKDAAAPPGQPAGPQQLQTPSVRKNFADTALWVGALTTDKEGKAKVDFQMPESLTTWKLNVWGLSSGTRVGEEHVELVTRKNLLVRLQAPRFFVQTDEVVLSANVHNYLKTDKDVQVKLELEGGVLEAPKDSSSTVRIPAGGEKRIDWRVKVTGEGQATVRMLALSDEESDAMQQSFPAYVHGFLKVDSYSGALRPEDAVGKLTVKVPAERRPAQTRLEIRYSPSLAGAAVDALPYLAEYPYGCTEQTLNRFLPTVVVRKALQDMKIDLAAIQKKAASLNAQQLGDPAKRAAKDFKVWNRNPVFDAAVLDDMVKTGVQKLTEMQLSDGGWGWFSGWREQSWPHTTAVVVHGLQTAAACDTAIAPDVLKRGLDWLEAYQNRQIQMLKNADGKKDPWKHRADDLDAMIFMTLVDGGRNSNEMKEYLFRDRLSLTVYSNAMFGVALHKLGDKEKLGTILENVSQFVVQDEENQSAWLRLPEGNRWWCWYGNDVEAMAYYLKLLSLTDPQGKTASRLAKYLVNNRRNGTYWNSTRDTALCVESLCGFMKASGEQAPDLTVEVLVDGKVRKEVKITADDLFSFDGTVVLEGDALPTGDHVVELRKTGKSPLYYNAYMTNFTMEDSITRAGLEVKVNRKIYKLTKKEDAKGAAPGARGQAVEYDVEKYDRHELAELATLKSGDLVEVELEIDSKNDYEYLLFEDMKAAGFEAVDVRSGYVGKSIPVYMEVRDNRVCFFMRALPQGKSSVSYRLRAEIPGKFSALPAVAAGMYAPELRGNSDEIKLQIVD